MRYDPNHKDRTRERLLKAAADQMRLHGPDGVSVASVMKRAGLTHGGFYAHFDSKDALIAAALGAMFEDAARRRVRSGGMATSIDSFIDLYVSAAHRDNARGGCPIPSLMSESARWPKVARAEFDRGVARLAQLLGELLPEDLPAREGAALSLVAEMAGAVALSRAISDPALSEALLASSRAALKTRFAKARGVR